MSPTIEVRQDGELVHSTTGVSSNIVVDSACKECGYRYKAGSIVVNDGKDRCSFCGGEII